MKFKKINLKIRRTVSFDLDDDNQTSVVAVEDF